MPAAPAPRRIVALCGGVGGSKLALGLYKLMEPGSLTLVVNTGDDFEHLGLHVSPDIDTVLYTLAGLADPVQGWGRHDETWNFMDTLARLGGPAWFRLGDRDLAMHVRRTDRLRAGASLAEVTREFTEFLNIDAEVVPMTSDRARTMVDTDEGLLPFQEYFVARRCEPPLRKVLLQGAASAHAHPEVLAAMAAPTTRAIVICPSNPYLSIAPILAIPGIKAAIAAARAPVIAISPIVGGEAVKGPTAKIMRELGKPVTQDEIAAHYRGLIQGLVLDESDRDAASRIGLSCRIASTVMRTLDDKVRLARDVCEFADALRLSSIEPGH